MRLLTDLAFDGRGGVITRRTVTIANGRIAAIDSASPDAGAAVTQEASDTATTIDLRGYTVMPGWIDTHVHLDSHFDRSGRIATETEPAAEWALGIALAGWETLLGGFTTVQTVGDPSEGAVRDIVRDHGFRVRASSARSPPSSGRVTARGATSGCARWCASARSRGPTW